MNQLSMHMAASKKALTDHYEDVLKQILSEVAELRQEIEINANERLQKYQCRKRINPGCNERNKNEEPFWRPVQAFMWCGYAGHGRTLPGR